jgi:uncharacterized protein YbaP (TraB family)
MKIMLDKYPKVCYNNYSKERNEVHKMKIEKNDYDVIYPYAIKDAWCGTIHCTKEDLIKLKKEIEKILDK